MDVDFWAQMIMKEPNDPVERVVAAPPTGIYHLDDDGSLHFVRTSHDWHEVTHGDRAFYLRVYGHDDYRFKGADLGILVTKGHMQTADGLTDRARHYIDGIRRFYTSEPLEQPPPTPVPLAYVK
jgi:hypothetical protein